MHYIQHFVLNNALFVINNASFSEIMHYLRKRQNNTLKQMFQNYYLK